jgi:hypothetical protein
MLVYVGYEGKCSGMILLIGLRGEAVYIVMSSLLYMRMGRGPRSLSYSPCVPLIAQVHSWFDSAPTELGNMMSYVTSHIPTILVSPGVDNLAIVLSACSDNSTKTLTV